MNVGGLKSSTITATGASRFAACGSTPALALLNQKRWRSKRNHRLPSRGFPDLDTEATCAGRRASFKKAVASKAAPAIGGQAIAFGRLLPRRVCPDSRITKDKQHLYRRRDGGVVRRQCGSNTTDLGRRVTVRPPEHTALRGHP